MLQECLVTGALCYKCHGHETNRVSPIWHPHNSNIQTASDSTKYSFG